MNTEDPKNASRIKRRDLLKTAASTGLVLALPMLDSPVEAAAAQWQPIGTAGEFEPGVPKRVVLFLQGEEQ